MTFPEIQNQCSLTRDITRPLAHRPVGQRRPVQRLDVHNGGWESDSDHWGTRNLLTWSVQILKSYATRDIMFSLTPEVFQVKGNKSRLWIHFTRCQVHQVGSEGRTAWIGTRLFW
eukprot:s12_g31.t1